MLAAPRRRKMRQLCDAGARDARAAECGFGTRT